MEGLGRMRWTRLERGLGLEITRGLATTDAPVLSGNLDQNNADVIGWDSERQQIGNDRFVQTPLRLQRPPCKGFNGDAGVELRLLLGYRAREPMRFVRNESFAARALGHAEGFTKSKVDGLHECHFLLWRVPVPDFDEYVWHMVFVRPNV